jgi:iron complex transport system permease protein
MTTHSRCIAAILLAVSAAALIGFAALLVGAKPMSPEAAIRAVFVPNRSTDGIIVWTLRMPRSIAAFLAGAALAVAGLLLQVITRNPLAAPDLTGVSAGAVVLIVFTFVVFPAVSSVLYPFIGMSGGLLAAAMTIWAARAGRAPPLHLALSGITVSLFLNALTAYILIRGAPQSPSVLFWLSGGFQGRSWPQVTYMLPWIVLGIGAALASHRVIGLLALGDEASAGMGLNTARCKLLLLLCAAALVAGVTPVAGPIAFIGLTVPHLVRLLRPAEAISAILLNASFGGVILLTADALARSVAAPREIPVSIFTALIGGPIFLYLVQKRERLPSGGGAR